MSQIWYSQPAVTVFNGDDGSNNNEDNQTFKIEG